MFISSGYAHILYFLDKHIHLLLYILFSFGGAWGKKSASFLGSHTRMAKSVEKFVSSPRGVFGTGDFCNLGTAVATGIVDGL
jgi:hypothetical protein